METKIKNLWHITSCLWVANALYNFVLIGNFAAGINAIGAAVTIILFLNSSD